MILAGMAEKEEKGRYFISHFAAGPEGMIGIYRKIHLGPRKRGSFKPGRSVRSFLSLRLDSEWNFVLMGTSPSSAPCWL